VSGTACDGEKLHIPAGATVRVTAAVQPNKPCGRRQDAEKKEPSLSEQRRILVEKGISLFDSALKGADLDELIRLLYRNRDPMATYVEELPGTN
jgi:hypothetical protein